MSKMIELEGYIGETEKIESLEKAIRKAAEYWMMPRPIKSAKITKRVEIVITIVERK